VRDSFAEHLGQTENLNPADWATDDMQSELTKGLARIDQAKAIYNQSRARLAALRHDENAESEMPSGLGSEMVAYEPKSFGAMVRDGFAYSLPLIVFGVALLITYAVLHH
jgi:hypothetical protein